METKLNNEQVTYIVYKDGRERLVSREEWERDWFEWYQRISRKRQADQTEAQKGT